MWSPGHFSHCFNLHNTSLSVPLSHLCSTLSLYHFKLIWLKLRYFYSSAGMDCSSWSELLLCVSTAGLFEQGQASQHLGHRQLSVDFVVSRTHIDTISHLLLLPDHCQYMRRQQLDMVQVFLSHTHTATLTHCPLCAAELNNCGWLVSLELDLVYIEPIKTHYSNSE